MKKIFVLLFIISFAVTSCSDDEERDVILDTTSVRLINGGTTSFYVSGGSGKFFVTINNPEIAEVEINSDNCLFIQSKKRGEAVISVIDYNSGKSADCSLTVVEDDNHYIVMDIQYAVDAEVKEAIEADIKVNMPFPIGSQFNFSVPEDSVIIKNSDYREILKGTYSTESMSITNPDIPESYKLLPPNNQIIAIRRYNMVFENSKYVYDQILVKSNPLTYSSFTIPTTPWFYEDLTEYYKAKYPNAGVKGVVRVLICHKSERI